MDQGFLISKCMPINIQKEPMGYIAHLKNIIMSVSDEGYSTEPCGQ
jgi:hypothetical protein